MRYQIVCTTRKDNNTIDQLGYIRPDGDPVTAQFKGDKEKINELIRNGDAFFFTDGDGTKVEVIAVEDDHVKTKPDGTTKNNLLHLRLCNF